MNNVINVDFGRAAPEDRAAPKRVEPKRAAPKRVEPKDNYVQRGPGLGGSGGGREARMPYPGGPELLTYNPPLSPWVYRMIALVVVLLLSILVLGE